MKIRRVNKMFDSELPTKGLIRFIDHKNGWFSIAVGPDKPGTFNVQYGPMARWSEIRYDDDRRTRFRRAYRAYKRSLKSK